MMEGFFGGGGQGGEADDVKERERGINDRQTRKTDGEKERNRSQKIVSFTSSITPHTAIVSVSIPH